MEKEYTCRKQINPKKPRCCLALILIFIAGFTTFYSLIVSTDPVSASALNAFT
jgi:hypothetical protein